VGLTAATGFGVALVLVRLGHPATAISSPTRIGTHSGSTASSEEGRRGSTLGGGSIAPSSGGYAPLATATS
jgi:hypothetical protein